MRAATARAPAPPRAPSHRLRFSTSLVAEDVARCLRRPVSRGSRSHRDAASTSRATTTTTTTTTTRCGVGEQRDKQDATAKEDDARQYGVWGVDGIRQRSASFAAMEADWEDEVAKCWTRAGASEVATQRLLILGAKWQKGALGEIYRDPEAVRAMVDALAELLPGASPAKIFHGEPAAALVAVDRSSLSRTLVAIRTAADIPMLDLAHVISREPRLLTRDVAETSRTCRESVAALRRVLYTGSHTTASAW